MNAKLHNEMSGLINADPLFIEALNQWEKNLGKNPLYLAVLRNLAAMYGKVGNTESQLSHLKMINRVCSDF